MKLSFTEKMVLENLEAKKDFLIVHFKSFLKEDYVERALVLTIDENDQLINAYFSSNKFGHATWENGRGIINSHRWENEDDLDEVSYLSRRYPSLLENGIVSIDYTKEQIIPDVLDYLLDTELALNIFKITENDSSTKKLDWQKIIKKYRNISSEFIKNLLGRYESELEFKLYDSPEKKENIQKNKIESDQNNLPVVQNKKPMLLEILLNFLKNIFKLKKTKQKTKEIYTLKEHIKKGKSLLKKINKFKKFI